VATGSAGTQLLGARHDAFAEVATVCGLPLVVGLDQDGAGEARQGFEVGDTPTTSVRHFTKPLSKSQSVLRPPCILQSKNVRPRRSFYPEARIVGREEFELHLRRPYQQTS